MIRMHKRWLFPLAAMSIGLAAVPLVFGVLTGPSWALALVVVGLIAVIRR